MEANQVIWLNACQQRFQVKFQPTPDQQTLYDGYQQAVLQLEQNVKMLCYVPEMVATGDVAAHDAQWVHFHGGGLTTGEPQFEAWRHGDFKYARLENQIIVIPFYPLMPEASGQYIASHVLKILDAFASGAVNHAITLRFPTIKLAKPTILCSSASAGVFLAFRFVWYAERFGIKITAFVSLYPMLDDYIRPVGQKYGDWCPSDQEHKTIATRIVVQAAAARKQGESAIRLGRTPPDAMGILPLTVSGCRIIVDGKAPVEKSLWRLLCGTHSVNDILRYTLPQKSEGKCPNRPCLVVDVGELSDGLGADGKKALGVEFSEEQEAFIQDTGEVLPEKPSTWPPTFIAHGDTDLSCPIQDVQTFATALQTLYPEAKKRVYLFRGQAHAFDYMHPGCLRDMANHVKHQQMGEEEPKLSYSVMLSK